MKTININKQKGISLMLYPDNQPHVNINGISEGDEVKVVCSITDSIVLLNLLQCSDALDTLFVKKKILSIPYLMGARFDRLMQCGDSIDLRVISKLINSCNFEKVYLYDVHSDVSTMLINNSVNISNQHLVDLYFKEDAVLICPDAGASKKVDKYMKWNNTIKEVVYCNKNRDLTTGTITLSVLEPDKCKGKNCIIIDDLCDGGGTFLAIASQIKPLHLTLLVTHGIFSKGIDILANNGIDSIITSDSFCRVWNHKTVTTINNPL